MLALLFFVLYVCIPKNKGLGILAMVFDSLSFLFDFALFCSGVKSHDFGALLAFVGVCCFADLVMLYTVIQIFKKNKGNFN